MISLAQLMKRYGIAFLVLLAILLVAQSVYSQDLLTIASSCQDVTNDSRATFTVSHSALVDDKPVYKWTVVGGTIIHGQGTSSIEVQADRTANVVTATIEITNFPKPWNNKSTCSVRVVPDRYQKHWWESIQDPKKPDWEILPQEAGPGEVILSKRNELGLLSNFAPTPFVFHGKRYASLEGFWQMMKYPEGSDDSRARFPGLEWKYTRDQVAQMVSFEANHAGALASANMEKMKITWVSFEGKHFEYKPTTPGEHYKLIVEATWEKVKQNPEVKKVLLSTGDLILKPDHHQEANAPAAWRYYEILMEIRKQLQNREQ